MGATQDAGLPAEDMLSDWFAQAHTGAGSPWLTQGETLLLAEYGVLHGEGVRMMEASTRDFREPPQNVGWEIIGADAPGDNWDDHRDPAKALTLLKRKLRQAQQDGARLQYKLWIEAP